MSLTQARLERHFFGGQRKQACATFVRKVNTPDQHSPYDSPVTTHKLLISALLETGQFPEQMTSTDHVIPVMNALSRLIESQPVVFIDARIRTDTEATVEILRTIKSRRPQTWTIYRVTNTATLKALNQRLIQDGYALLPEGGALVIQHSSGADPKIFQLDTKNRLSRTQPRRLKNLGVSIEPRPLPGHLAGHHAGRTARR